MIGLTKKVAGGAYPSYHLGSKIIKDVVKLLVEEVNSSSSSKKKKYGQAYLILINRSIQHIESIRILTERGLYGDSFVLSRSFRSDLSMIQYLHFCPDLLDLYLNENREDYQNNKDFKNAFSESAIDKKLVSMGVNTSYSEFQVLSKALHASSFGSQLYCFRGEEKGQYYLSYGPKFQPEKALLLMRLVACSYYYLIGLILWHWCQADEYLETENWNKIKSDLGKLKKASEKYSEFSLEELNKLWDDGLE
jgi:hypothetical protein